MYEIPSFLLNKINRYEPITVENMTFYPLLMSEYNDYLMAKPAIEFMQRSFRDIKLITLPLLSAYYKVDYDALREGRQVTGLLGRALLFIILALRISPDTALEERLKQCEIVCDTSDPSKLVKVDIHGNNGEIYTITPTMFARLRVILAKQNGVELVSDDANPDLIEADRYLAEINSANLKVDMDDMISSVAALSRTDESDIYSWSILKFTRRSNSWNRIVNHIICGIGETQGTSWKGGNPYPSMWFDKKKEDSSALISIKEFAGGAGERAINNAGKETF